MSLRSPHLNMTELVVERSHAVAPDIQLFELRHPGGGELAPFTAGAHLVVRVPNGSERKYSLCNDPSERDRYVIAVKRERNGRGGSISLIENTRAGSRLPVSTPHNDFGLVNGAVRYVFIAGGIGITPIRAMILHLLNSGGSAFRLYYFARTPEMMPFRDEFTSSAFHGKVVLHFDGGDPAKAFDLWPVVEEQKAAHIYCCGPRSLMETVRDMTGHWSSSAVHFEDFGAGRGPAGTNDRPFRVRLAKTGRTLDVPIGTTILDVLRDNGINIATSCESGTCGTCRTKLIAGEADHRDLVLSEHERSRAIMVCVSRSRSEELVIDV
jgi:phthalate 4,5-dioxygenase reductase subunit